MCVRVCAEAFTWFINSNPPGVLLDAVHRGRAHQSGLRGQCGARLAVGGVGVGAELQRAVGVGVIGRGGGAVAVAAPGEGAGVVLAACALQGDGVDSRGGRGYGGRVGTEQKVQDLFTKLVHGGVCEEGAAVGSSEHTHTHRESLEGCPLPVM